VTIEDKVYEVEVEIEDMERKLSELTSSFSKSTDLLSNLRRVRTLPAPTIVRKGEVRAPMPGRVLSIKVREGDEVKKGDVLLVMESMKAQVEVRSPMNGVVKKLLVREAESVRQNQPLVLLE